MHALLLSLKTDPEAENMRERKLVVRTAIRKWENIRTDSLELPKSTIIIGQYIMQPTPYTQFAMVSGDHSLRSHRFAPHYPTRA